MLEYSEYKTLVDILEKSGNHETTYQDVMKKEDKVLDTLNNVTKYYRDDKTRETQFVNMPVHFVIFRFFNVWLDIYNELINTNFKTIREFTKIFTKEDRLIYIGIFFVLISFFIYFVDSTKNLKQE